MKDKILVPVNHGSYVLIQEGRSLPWDLSEFEENDVYSIVDNKSGLIVRGGFNKLEECKDYLSTPGIKERIIAARKAKNYKKCCKFLAKESGPLLEQLENN